MNLIIPQRSIWHCNLDTNGRTNACPKKCKNSLLSKEKLLEIPKHFFIITSKKNDEDFVTALPLSSHEYQIEKNAGESIHAEDIESLATTKNKLEITKLTLILSNKICRIPVDALKSGEEKGILKKERYRDIIWPVKSCLDPD